MIKPKSLQKLHSFPKQFSEGFIIGSTMLASWPKRSYKEIIVSGMGGSVLGGRLLKTVFPELKIKNPLIIWNNYGFPEIKFENPILICTSYSGNTEETLSTFKEAKKRKIPIVVIASGGKLIELAVKTNTPFVLVPTGYSPRMAFGYLFGSLLGALYALKLIPNVLPHLKTVTANDVSKIGAKASLFAKFLWPGIPVIYISEDYDGLGHIWKIALNETGKMPAFHYNLPELNHNEMMGFASNPGPHAKFYRALFLIDAGDHPRTKKRFKLTEKSLRKAKIKTKNFEMPGKNAFEKIILNSLLAYWTAYAIADRRRIDPENDSAIEDFKKEMAHRR